MRTVIISTTILLAGIAQYTLMAKALQDLRRRPRVRGNNKIVWGFVILCVPFAGAFVYEWIGPTSFLQRGSTQSSATPRQLLVPPTNGAVASSPTTPQQIRPSSAQVSAKITPIGAARSARAQRMPLAGPTTLRSQSRSRQNSGQTGS